MSIAPSRKELRLLAATTSRIAALTLIGLSLVACASTKDRGSFQGAETRDVQSAMASPVNDIGLNDIEIPEYLVSMTNPYANTPSSCDAIKADLATLNALLGSDLDIPEDEAVRREQTALNATSSTIGSVLIPFRGVVRAISGAAGNERDARQAYERGLVRRAYIKGMARQMNCSLPTNRPSRDVPIVYHHVTGKM